MARWKKYGITAGVLAVLAFPGTGRAQTLSSGATAYYGSGSGTSLMTSLGFTDMCAFYYFVTIGTTGSFPLSILRSHFPQCANWTPPSLEEGSGGEDDGSGEETGNGGTGGVLDNGGTGGTGGTGETGGTGGIGGTGDTGGTGGSGDPGGTGGDGDEWNEIEPPAPEPDWTDGGGSATVTPEPMSLLLLGTGLAGLGGVRLARRRKTDIGS